MIFVKAQSAANVERRPSARHDEDMIVAGVTVALSALWTVMIFAMVGFTHFFVP